MRYAKLQNKILLKNAKWEDIRKANAVNFENLHEELSNQQEYDGKDM